MPRKRSRIFPKFVALLILAGVALYGGYRWLTNAMDRPHTHEAARKSIVIEPGSSSGEILAKLSREGVIESEYPIKIWLRVFGENKRFKAGEYEFKSPITPRQVVNLLAQGSVSTRQFTIPEGYNHFDVASVLSGLEGLKEPIKSPGEVVAMMRNVALIQDLDPKAKDLEGYLFPDTYEYAASTTREKLIEVMVKRFRKVFTPELQERARQMNMTPRQVVALASLVEKEAKVDTEREMISQVFHKRLKMGAPLACDPTVIYAALIEGKYKGKIYRSDLDRDSPYNTYKHAGLPPGPIASPGKRSLQAALYPSDTDYLFFVVDATRNDGSHKFSASSSDHDRAVQLLRQQERELKAQ
jgi:UPF0755 protein